MTRPTTRAGSIFDRRVRADQTRVRLTQGRVSNIRAYAAGGVKAAKSREIVVRVLGKAKHAAGPLAQARYIARVNTDEHKVDKSLEASQPLETHDARVLRTRAEVDKEIASWGLKPAHENRSKTWRDAGTDQRREIDERWRAASPEWRRGNPKADPYARVQSTHIIVSVPTGSPSELRDAVRQVARDHFNGHKYVWTVHTDHGRGPHAHFVVQYSHAATGKSLDLRKGKLEQMRQDFAQACRGQGIDVLATRRVDRLAQEIAHGHEPFHKHDRSRGRWTPADTIRKKAPEWHAAHGPAWEACKAGIAEPPPTSRGYIDRFLRRPPAELKSEAFRETLSRFGHYSQPVPAAKSYLALYAEDPRLAQWVYAKQPSAFGSLGADPPTNAPDGGTAARALREIDAAKLRSTAPTVDGQRIEEAARGRATQRRQRGAEAVIRSNEALARSALDAGDELAAEDAIQRASAARNARPMPDYREPSTEGTRMAKKTTSQKTPQQMLDSYISAEAKIAKIKADMRSGSTAQLLSQLRQAQLFRRKAAETVLNNPAALELAQTAGLQRQLAQFQLAHGKGLGIPF